MSRASVNRGLSWLLPMTLVALIALAGVLS